MGNSENSEISETIAVCDLKDADNYEYFENYIIL